MADEGRVARLVGVRSGEGTPVGLAVAASFFASAGLMIGQSGIEALFFAGTSGAPRGSMDASRRGRRAIRLRVSRTSPSLVSVGRTTILPTVERSTGFARLGTDRIAYEVVGSGSIDLVLSAGSFGAFDTDWEDPMSELFLRRLASFVRLIRFDRRGTGGSDPLPLDALPPWESFVEELEAVMHQVGSKRAAIMATYDAGPMGMLFATTKPERTAALILVNTSSKYVASDDYPVGVPPEAAEEPATRWPNAGGAISTWSCRCRAVPMTRGSARGTRRRPA